MNNFSTVWNGEKSREMLADAKKAKDISRAFVLGGFFTDEEAGTAVYLKAGQSAFISYNGQRCRISDEVAIAWVQYEDVHHTSQWKRTYTGTTQRDRLEWESHSRDEEITYTDRMDPYKM